MSNYNTNLQSNNIDLQAILDTINELPSAGNSEPTLQDKTVTPTTSIQTITADSGYDGLDTVTVNAMPTATQATPSITINSSGLITAKATQTAGYVEAGTKSATKQLAFQAAKTITPGTTSQVAVSSGYYVGGNVTVAGDANLVPTNIVNGKTIFGVTGTATVGSGSGESGGSTDVEDSLVTRTVTTYTNTRLSTVGNYAFADCTKLTAVDFPLCTSIGSNAFTNCTSLVTVSFPECVSIGIYAFSSCRKLISVNFPKCTTISSSAFYNCNLLATISFPNCATIDRGGFYYCSSLTTIDFPKCSNIGSYAFFGCKNLTSANFPVCTTIFSNAFYSCIALQTISFPACTTINSNAFVSCKSLISINFPACITVSSSAFYNCFGLTTASFPKCTKIGNYAFKYCSSLTTMYLMASTICTLDNSNAFSNTGITSTTGLIYIPASLLTSYKKATNWAYFSARFVGLEGDGEIISFTFNGTSYQAPGGITWKQWEATEYNTDNDFVVYSDVVTYQDSIGNRTAVIDDTGTKVKPNDLIKSNGVYTT